MSRLWNKTRLRLYLAPGCLQLAVIKGRWRPVVVHKQNLMLPTQDCEGMLAQLSPDLLRDWRGAALEVVLSAAFVRCLFRPWDAGCVAEEEARAVAAALFDRQFVPALAADHLLTLDRLRYGQPQLAMAVERALHARLELWAVEHGFRLAVIAPLPLLAWNRFEPLLRRQAKPLVVLEETRATLLCHEQGGLQSLRVRPCTGIDGMALRQAFGSALPDEYLVFSAQASGAARALTLRTGTGFSPHQDSQFAFSLCGVF